MIQVELADPAITVHGWTKAMDKIGEYTLKLRKTPEEIKAERETLRARYGGNPKVQQMKYEKGTVIEHDADDPETVYFLPGLWPRVKDWFETNKVEYEITADYRNPDIRPPIDFEAIKDVQFREGQDTALALIATADCGVIETTTGWGKCHHGDTPILMYDGSIKKAKDVVVGDLLMGDDSTPRVVQTTTQGHGPMYRYTPIKGEAYIFNGDHKLSLVQCRSSRVIYKGMEYEQNDILDISINDYLRISNGLKSAFKAYRVGADFAPIEAPKLDPYFVGVYLGDGSQKNREITTPDREILDYCEKYIESIGWEWHYAPNPERCTTLRMAHKKGTSLDNCPRYALRDACCFPQDGTKNRHMAPEYRYGSRETRLQVLAGLLDTDGYLNGACNYEITTKYDVLADDIIFVARSLGLAVYSKRVQKGCQTGYVGWYHRISIGGNTCILPLKVARKKAAPYQGNKDPMHTGFTIEPIGDGDFYGFSVNGNHRYLLGDFTVTHNSFLISVICKAFPTLNILICTGSTSVVSTLYEYLCKQVPGQVGILMGGKDNTHGKRIIVSTLRSMSKIPATGPNLVLCDENHECAANLAGQDIIKFCWARRFGFSASPFRSDGSQLVLESIFGPTILKMSYEEAQEHGMVVPMRYTMLPCNWMPSICLKEGISDVTLKRYAYWCNKVRNQAIADFVYRLHKVAPNAQVLVICSTLQHCIMLHLLLPFFKVLYYGSTNMSEMEKHFPKEKYPNLDLSKYKSTAKQLEIGRAAFAKGTLKWVISTMVLKQGINASHLRVLIRADGATSKILGIQIPGRLSRLDDGKDCGYLVDVADGGSPWTKRRADCREALYKEQGWTRITPQDVLHDFAGQGALNDTSRDTTIPAETTAGQCSTEES